MSRGVTKVPEVITTIVVAPRFAMMVLCVPGIAFSVAASTVAAGAVAAAAAAAAATAVGYPGRCRSCRRVSEARHHRG